MPVAVGHNILGFDLPYLVRWSIQHGIKIPSQCVPFNGRYPKCFQDTVTIDGAGEWGYRVSLDNLSKRLGLGEKNGSGEFFYQMPREEQIKYLTNDLILCLKVFYRQNHSLGIVDEEGIRVFDIETEPKPRPIIERIAPKFNPSDVKLGRLKDEEKIKDKIAEAEANHLSGILKKAGLHAHYSDPVAIGYINCNEEGEETILDFAEDDPESLVERFWKWAGAIALQNKQQTN